MPKITYPGPEPFSSPVEVAQASTLSLPRDVPCEVSEEQAAKLLAAGQGFTVDAPGLSRSHNPNLTQEKPHDQE